MDADQPDPEARRTEVALWIFEMLLLLRGDHPPGGKSALRREIAARSHRMPHSSRTRVSVATLPHPPPPGGPRPSGARARSTPTILVPAHPDCTFNGRRIVASFHTHPNTGPEYLQEPGETDRRAIRDDPDLKGPSYLGEFVVSQATVYLVTPTGQVREVEDTPGYLG